jgi:hypothetical protein
MPTSSSLVTNLPADFNTFGQGVDTSLQDLLGGTTGQVLSKTSGTNMDFTWVTPTDQTPLTTKGDLFAFSTVDARLPAGANETRLVADSGETLGLKYVADTTNYAIAAKADLLVGTAADTLAALTVGTNGQVLTADSTVSPTGLKWATPAGGSSIAYTLLNSPSGTALTGATTVTISGISGKEYLLVLIEDAGSASASSSISLRINTDTGSNYAYMGILNIGTPSISATGASPNSGTTRLPFGQMDSTAASSVYGSALILGGTSTGTKSVTITGSGGSSGGDASYRQYAYTGIYKASAAITSISIVSSTGNLDSGTVWVYGA